MTPFKNSYLSYSRLSRYEQCPLSFRLHYIEKQTSEPNDSLRFGKAIHSVLEQLVREHMDQERCGALSVERAARLWQKIFGEQILYGTNTFIEGLDIIKAFIHHQGHLDHHDILAVEKEFHLPVGPFTVLGYIDRVDRIDDQTVEVIDYKTNRMLFTREHVENSLQLSLYHLAAQQLWPWAKDVKLAFHMLRHDIKMVTSRSPEDLEKAKQYVLALGNAIESTTEFPARLNANCTYCDHRQQCLPYKNAIGGEHELFNRIEISPSDDVETVAKERKQVATLAKILYTRQKELDNRIKAHLHQHDELVVDNVRYQMFNVTKNAYPVNATLKMLSEITHISPEQLLAQVASIDKKSVDAFLKGLKGKLDKSTLSLLKAKLDIIAEKTYSPRLWAKEVG